MEVVRLLFITCLLAVLAFGNVELHKHKKHHGCAPSDSAQQNVIAQENEFCNLHCPRDTSKFLFCTDNKIVHRVYRTLRSPNI